MKIDIPNYDERETYGELIIIHPYDTWNMDQTLAKIILPMLKQLKETQHGAPAVDFDDVPEHLHPPTSDDISKLYQGETDENYFERWYYVMDEMIYAFEHIVDDSWEDKYFVYDENMFKENEKKSEITDEPLETHFDEMEELTEYKITKTAKFDSEGYRQVSDRIANGTRLFGKYYRALWD